MRDLMGRSDLHVWALNQETLKIERAQVSNAFSTGLKRVYRLTTRLGRTIRATANHKFLTIDGWRRLDQVEQGAPLAIPRKVATHQSDIFWDRVASVDEEGVDEVFDLTVPGPHNFIANDLFVHNSIEQDADVVAFIYRDEVYNPENEESQGIAELIVGKNRNGQTGTVSLAFFGETTTFRSLSRHSPG
jgi:replicative DNA helicase